MTNLFVSILNMSITASYVAVAVILARVFLRRAPKIFSYILWSAVLIRLVIPFSFTSGFSILRVVQPEVNAGSGVMAFIPQDIGLQLQPFVDTGIRGMSRVVDTSLPAAAPMASVNPMQIVLWIASIIWLTGAALLFLNSLISYLRVLSTVRTANLVQNNIFETDQIAAPFVCGFVKPRIYIPAGMSGHELSYIILHEQTHIRRRDYLIKPFVFLLLIIHWFNPLMWLSYALMGKDMEMSCDERVVTKLGPQIKGSYSTSLLSLAAGRSRSIGGSPLAFGESNVKARIKNILAYRQPSSRRVVCSLLLIVPLVIGCTANPAPVQTNSQPLYSGYKVANLIESRTKYVGNNSKVAALIGEMPWPAGLEGAGIELKTGSHPYELTINFVMNDYAGVWKDGAISRDSLYRNSILLFSLIDNVDNINYTLADNTGQFDGASYRFTFSKEEVDQLLGGDAWQYTADETGLRQLIDRLATITTNARKTMFTPSSRYSFRLMWKRAPQRTTTARAAAATGVNTGAIFN